MSFIGYADPDQLKLLSQALSEYCRANGKPKDRGERRYSCGQLTWRAVEAILGEAAEG